MHDAGLVRCLETRRQLLRQLHDARHRQMAVSFERCREVVPLDKRHADVLRAADISQIVNADDVLVGDLAGEQELALEAALDVARHRGIGADVRTNDLESDDDVEDLVPRLIHNAHTAGAELFEDAIPRSEGIADVEPRAASGDDRGRGANPRLVARHAELSLVVRSRHQVMYWG